MASMLKIQPLPVNIWIKHKSCMYCSACG